MMMMLMARQLTIFQVKPVSAAWTNVERIYIIDVRCYNRITPCITLFFDVAVLLMPLSVIHKLHIPFRRKLAVMMIFSLGGLCCCATAMRVHYMYRGAQSTSVGPNPFQTYSKITYLAQYQLSTSIVAASLPTLCPVFFSLKAPMESLLNNILSLFSTIGASLAAAISTVLRRDTSERCQTQQTMVQKQYDNRPSTYFDDEFELNRLYLSDSDSYISPPLPVRIKL